MSQPPIRFDDGAAYERAMGVWSRLAGEIFLDWLAPPSGLRWLDIGCGNGAFTELLARRCAPGEMNGIDPSEAQLAFARTRPGVRGVTFFRGDAMALPFDADRFDAAVMALVIFFVPDPAQGLAEMARVVRPGGIVAAYAWEMFDGGFPFHPIWEELRAVGVAPPLPPSVDISRMETLSGLWTDASLEAVASREIAVKRTFVDFDDFWTSSTTTGIAAVLAGMPADDVARLKARVRARLPSDADGRITYGARANAIKGRVPNSS